MGRSVTSFDQLLFVASPFPSPGEWQLIRSRPFQLLPIGVEFGSPCLGLTPARELYSVGELESALRFVELVVAADPTPGERNWQLHLVNAMLLLECGRAADAWSQLQHGLSLRNESQSAGEAASGADSIATNEWLVMATVALAAKDFDSAEQYASECVAIFDRKPSVSVGELLSDCRADAMTVFAAIRLAQEKLREAEMLLQLAYDAYAMAGDMHQLVVVLTLLADVEQLSGSPVSASYLLCEAQNILDDECDFQRHHRLRVLKEAVASRRRQRRRCGRKDWAQCLN